MDKLSQKKLRLQLLQLGAVPGLKGFDVMREALTILMCGDSEPEMGLYDKVADRLGVTAIQVQRNLRHMHEKIKRSPGPLYLELEKAIGLSNLHNLPMLQFLAVVTEWLLINREDRDVDVLVREITEEQALRGK